MFTTPKPFALIVIVCVAVGAGSAAGTDIFLDADTPTTGSVLPLVTPYGTINFRGEIVDHTDPEFTAAGALGYSFDIDGSDTAELTFGFDIASATFIYGGNSGIIRLYARDAGGGVVDSFYQADTYHGMPAGPETVAGNGIRSLYWEDPGNDFCALDNISIVVPEPATLALLALGGLAVIRRRR